MDDIEMHQHRAQAHRDIVLLWEEYQTLWRQVCTLAEAVGELEQSTRTAGQKIYTLYTRSDAGLDGSFDKNT